MKQQKRSLPYQAGEGWGGRTGDKGEMRGGGGGVRRERWDVGLWEGEERRWRLWMGDEMCEALQERTDGVDTMRCPDAIIPEPAGPEPMDEKVKKVTKQ